jgi:exopolysaccharide biosynthesis polyprenyl glycosylphosphotransferase
MYRLKQIILTLGDLILLYVGLYAALAIRYQELPTTQLYAILGPMNLLLLFSPVILFISGAYDLVKIKNTWNFYKKILVSALVWLVTGVLYFYLNPDLKIAPKTILLLTTIVGFSLIALWRYFHSRYVAQIIKKTTVIFLGATPETEELALIINKEPERGYQLTGIFNPSHTLLSTELARYTIQNSQELKNKMNSETIGLIVISPDLSREDALLGIMYENLFKQVELVSLAEFYERIMERIPPFTFSESWFLTNLREQQKKMYDRFRILIDYVTAALLSIVGLVTLPFVALLIKSTSRGPVFYHQLRIGQHGRTFRIYKYRTMKVLSADGSAETAGAEYASENDIRITSVGKLLRKTRLDELPQVINILRGEMSFIGPRPERPEFVQKLTAAMPFYSLRHLVKPGLTGWAQIHKGYYGTIDENLQKLEYDLFYIKNRGPLIDLAITLRTINIVLRMKGR